MKYHLTLINPEGVLLEHTVNLPVEDTITWHDFVQLSAVREVMMLNPTCELVDVTPDGMPDWFTDDQLLQITLNHQGIRKRQNQSGATVYEDLESSDLDLEA